MVTSKKMEEVGVDQTSVTMPTPNVQLLRKPRETIHIPFFDITLQLENTVGRNHIITFQQPDLDTLKPCTYVNDNVIDFWLLWVSRNDAHITSKVQIFTSHFYTKLTEEGVEYVARWHENRKLDILNKKILMLPINLQSHWSLCVVINVGNLSNYLAGMQLELHTEFPFMMLLDS